MKQIVLFNNKGGVGKTTFLMHLGFALEKAGKKVLFIDADPQCNLTSYMCSDEQIEAFWKSEQSIYGAVSPLIKGTGDIKEIQPYKRPNRNIWLLPGDLLLSQYEESLSRAWIDALAGREVGFRITSSIYRLINNIAAAKEIDFILVDVGPNLGSLNRAILLGCDHFIVPLVPDLFSLRGLENIGKTFVQWINEWQNASQRFKEKPFLIQHGKPAFAGYVNQQFNIYKQREANAWKNFTERVPSAVKENIVNKLKEIDEKLVIDLNGGSYNLGDVRNYHSLAPLAQSKLKPIFELGAQDGVFGTHSQNANECLRAFMELANRLIDKLI
jgi:chromosome partitioning protein